MTITGLSLPIDIPWKRICVSKDMMDEIPCDREFPFKWRSSLAVFSFTPEEEEQTDEESLVTYLKVVCTITGFQPDPEEVGITNKRIDSYWNDPIVIENFKDAINRYYGCYGAIIQVGVYPSSDQDVSIDKYPYFADFEPKNREIYETVTETGETMSRSTENINVRKGTSTTDSHEVLDIFGGFSQEFQYAGTGGGHSVTGQWGTRDLSQGEYTNIRTTDSSRESRELYSHSTTLTQMYTELSSYHAGTNRVVFFMLPRPHIVQSETTFVNGPRQLEGIQEFFLVVMRPRDVKDICVEAYLETGHIADEPITEYETSTGELDLYIYEYAPDKSGSTGDDSYTLPKADSVTYNPPPGWEIDLGREGGYKITSVSGEGYLPYEYSISSIGTDHITLSGKVYSRFVDRTWPESNYTLPGKLNVSVTVYIRKIIPNIVGYEQNLWITGRGVCCGDCTVKEWDFPFFEPFVVFEGPKFNLDNIITQKREGKTDLYKPRIGESSSFTVLEANKIRNEVKNHMMDSMSSPNRYPRGKIGFLDTNFISKRITDIMHMSIEHPDNKNLSEIRGINREVFERVRGYVGDISRQRFLSLPTLEAQKMFNLSLEETRQLKRAVLGLDEEIDDQRLRRLYFKLDDRRNNQ